MLLYVAKKICRSSCEGPFFVGAPVQPNMLNMPKSAAEDTTMQDLKMLQYKLDGMKQ